MPVFNGMPDLPQQLEALTRQTYDGVWELLLADNGSTDESVRCATTYGGRLPLVLIDATSATGKPGTMNLAADRARGAYLVFCDQDDVVADDWLAAIVGALNVYPVIGGHADDVSLNGEKVSAWRPSQTALGLSRPFGYLPAPLGANAGMRRDLFRQVGGFDLRFSEAAEDTDLFWRVGRLGFPVRYAPEAVVAYRHRREPRKLLRQYRAYGRARSKLAAKYSDVFLPDPLWRAVPSFLWCIVHLVDLVRGQQRRIRYLRMMSSLLGQLEESLMTGFPHVTFGDPRRVQSAGQAPFIPYDVAGGAMAEQPKYDFPREDLLPFIPDQSRTLLDVGCGGGGFGRTLLARWPDIEVSGIEPDGISVRAAGRAGYRQVVQGLFPAAVGDLARRAFEVITFNDVLEHMPHPAGALEAAHALMAPGGTLIASVPNVRNWSVWWPLVTRGRWDYTKYGILDETHLRFFTKETLRELFVNAGWDVADVVGVNHNGIGRKDVLRRLGRARTEQFFWTQYVVVASSGRMQTRGAGLPRIVSTAP